MLTSDTKIRQPWMKPNFPFYIPSKGRWDSRLTAKVFDFLKLPYHVIVEEQEYKNYCAVIDKKKIMVLDKKYQRDYDAFSNLGIKKSNGPGPARNFAWDHSVANGHAWHWVVDDNISMFWRMNKNTRLPVSDGTIFRCMEDFCLRYKNIAMAGPNYFGPFTTPRHAHKPFKTNTRIYSCNLIRNDVGFRWRGRYNEDTDLSLRMLKAGWVTVLFNAFIQRKVTTQEMVGGNTEEFYRKEGTLSKSKMLVAMHPDVTRLVWLWKRWHHRVDYGSFRSNKLIRKSDLPPAMTVDNYGMELLTGQRSVHKDISAMHRNAHPA